MASLFEQYEQVTSQTTGYSTGTRTGYPEQGGFIRLEEEGQIFKKYKIDFRPTAPITHLVVANGIVVLVMSNNTLLRIYSKNQDQNMEVVDLNRTLGDRPAKVYQVFMDPNGKHVIVSLVQMDWETSLENYYLSQKAPNTALSMHKLKGHVVSAVGWNFDNPPDKNSTDFILVGTTKGIIFEMELVVSEVRSFFSSPPDQYCKQIFDLALDDSMGPVTGLAFHKYGTQGSENKCFIIVTTARRLYQFVGTYPTSCDPPVLQRIFHAIEDVSDRCVEVPSGLLYSCLQFYHAGPKQVPKKFGLMLEPGVLVGDVVVSGKDAKPDVVVLNQTLIQFNKAMKPPTGTSNPPLSMALTEFHTLVLYVDRIKVYCLLNGEIVFEEVFSEMNGRMIGLAKDPITGTIWVFSDSVLYRYKVEKEDRNVWGVYLEQGNYEAAKYYCRGDPEKLDRVFRKHAEDLFEKKEYVSSAEMYAETCTSFEEVSLRFLQMAEEAEGDDKEEALRRLLVKKLGKLKPSEKTQTTMIVMWLIELFLNRLGTLRTAGRQHQEPYQGLVWEFQNLLSDPKVEQCVVHNKSAVYKLIANHGEENILIMFANIMKDFERVIQYHIQNKSYKSALEVLTKQNNQELVYQFSPVLMQCIPKETVEMWFAQGRRLDPSRLIPALVQYDKTNDKAHGFEAINYLEFCVDKLKNEDEAIHNYLLTLYARLDPKKLMHYLELQGQDQTRVRYDLKYALRICSELNLTEACVHIYTTMELYEEAVDLALKVDIGVAKTIASLPEVSEELRKKLWLKIAEHVVKEKKDIVQAMEFLQECDLIKIEDILPFFDEFVTIDHFKEAICSSLEEYNKHIDELKEEMEEATKSAKEIRAEINVFRNKYSIVKADQKCSVCNFHVMNQAFYMFPCSHVFHADCLILEVQLHMIPTKRNRIEEIHRQLVSIGNRDDNVSVSSMSGPLTQSTREKLMNELDDLVASECLYCGEIAIQSIDEPFICPEEFEEVVNDWR
ncbi:vacuolar protein sorting-associated protein 18 homolog [Ornithodoros turicata]|uniref:vacuolar protein sorting-associated protein 18 homolog n=1 Tax=Ornithodoros turicata TaxID=34597 RepID=UPI003139305C